MLEIIALIFLTRQIGKMASAKGLKPSTWKWYLIGAWFVGEIFGAIAGVMFFGTDIFPVMIMGLAGAFTGYVIIRNVLSKKQQEDFHDDIDQLGKN